MSHSELDLNPINSINKSETNSQFLSVVLNKWTMSDITN